MNEIHLKYVDDLFLAESINLPAKLQTIPDSERSLPDVFRARTGHVLPLSRSVVYNQLLKTEKYAKDNHMQINYRKIKLTLFNMYIYRFYAKNRPKGSAARGSDH